MKYIVIILLSFGLTTHAQYKTPKDNFADIERMKAETESARVRLDRSMERSRKRLDSINMENFNKQNARNLDAMMHDIQERNRKQKQQMWIRLGFGVAMLVLLVVGLLRKRKK